MDLRAPLLDVEDDDTKRNDDLSPPWRRHCRACSKTEYTNNTVESPSTVTNVDPSLYEIISIMSIYALIEEISNTYFSRYDKFYVWVNGLEAGQR